MDKKLLTDLLMSVGLTEKEALIYVTSLSLESATAYRIAETARLKRPTVYITLEELRRKGLMLKIPHPKKTLFSARPLDEYLAGKKSQLAQIYNALPNFEALRRQPGAVVYFYSGLNGIKDALDYKFKSMVGKEYLSFYCNLHGVSQDLQLTYDKWDVDAVASNIKFRVIRARGKKQSMEHLSAEGRKQIQERYVDADAYPTSISFEIADDFIRITNAKEMFATIIESRETASALRLAFEIIWQGAKPV